jgi:hypothetical protein
MDPDFNVACLLTSGDKKLYFVYEKKLGTLQRSMLVNKQETSKYFVENFNKDNFGIFI